MLRKAKFILSVLLAIILILIPVSSIFAIDPPPTTCTIDRLNAYQGVIEDNDQFYLIEFTIPYVTYPDETANEAYLLRMFNAAGTVEITATGLYNNPYFHAGYGHGIVSFYFSEADVATYGLTWGDAYIFYLQGNPGSSWNGTMPNVAGTLGTWTNTDVEITLQTRILFLANQFQGQWGVQLIDSGTLSSYGEYYFISTIPYLRHMVSDIFTSYTEHATEFRERTHSLTYAITLRNQWLGTWLDLTDVGTDWDIDPIWIYGLMWLVVMVAVGLLTVAAERGLQRVQGEGVALVSSGSKALMYAEIFTIFFGGLLGFLPWLAAVLSGAIMTIIIINQIFFSKAYG